MKSEDSWTLSTATETRIIMVRDRPRVIGKIDGKWMFVATQTREEAIEKNRRRQAAKYDEKRKDPQWMEERRKQARAWRRRNPRMS
jgi:hypothetical protein